MRRVLACALVVCACTPDASAPTVEPANDLANPIVPGVGLLPWPSDQYLIEGSTRTGLTLAPPADLMPDGVVPGMVQGHDGFTRIPPILTWFDGGVDPASLPDPDDWGATTRTDSPILLVDTDTFTPVPLLAEVDLMAPDPALATLFLRPHRPLAPQTRYAVLIRTDLNGTDGAPVPRADALDAILGDEVPDDRALAWWHANAQPIVDAADALGIDQGDLAQAWTFTTRSEEQVTGPGLAIQDAMMQADASAYTIDDPIDDGDKVLVYGTLTAPDFLDADRRLERDDQGEPVALDTLDVPFLVTIPKVIDGPRPPVLFGHGFFSAIEEPTWSNLFNGLQQWEMPAVTTKFYGFTERELLTSLGVLGAEFSDLDTIIDQQLQSHGNFTLVHRMVTEHLADALEVDLGDGDMHPLDGSHMPYMGISNGGTQGLVLASTSPVIDRAALVVPGGGWAHMLQRAAQFSTLGEVLTNRYADPRMMQLGMSIMQQVFDPVDSLNYAEHLAHDRYEGRLPDPDILLVEAVNDSQVANLVSRWAAGAGDIPLVTPAPREVWGVDTVSPREGDGVNVGYAMYDLGVPDNPAGNIPPVENGVHNDVRLLDAYREQMGHFLLTGEVVHACDGACDPE